MKNKVKLLDDKLLMIQTANDGYEFTSFVDLDGPKAAAKIRSALTWSPERIGEEYAAEMADRSTTAK
jgi:hypothetical protein